MNNMTGNTARDRLRSRLAKLTPRLDSIASRLFGDDEARAHNIKRAALSLASGAVVSGARLALGTYPLGISILCASREALPFAYLGCALSALFNRGLALPLFGIYTIVFAVRIALCALLFRNKEVSSPFSEHISTRIIIAAASGFALGVWVLASGGFLIYDLLGAAFLTLVSPAATLLFACASGDCADRMPHKETLRVAGCLLFAFSLTSALADKMMFGFGLGIIAACIMTLAGANINGGTVGCTVGLVLGLPLGMPISLTLALLGLVSGVISKGAHSPSILTAASLFATAIGCAALALSSGGKTMLGYLPDILASCVIFIPTASLGLLRGLGGVSTVMLPSAGIMRESSVALLRGRSLETRMTRLSSSMESLAATFSGLSEKLRRPGRIELTQACEKVCLGICEGCRLRELCLDEEYYTSAELVSKLAKTLAKRGSICRDDVPAYMLERCEDADNIIASLNRVYAELLEDAVRRDKTAIFALDYAAMAKLLAETVAENEAELTLDKALTKQLHIALRHMGLTESTAEACVVYGRRHKHIAAGGVDLARMRVSANELLSCLENVCKCRLTQPAFTLDGDYVTMTLDSRPCYAVEYARAGLTRENERANGDTVNMFTGGDGYFYALISDGMGSGSEASLTSRLTAIILEKLLMGGGGKALALSMLNNFIKNKGLECFATVDLLEADLITGEASFVKSGASPSYIIRAGSIFKVASASMPVGITDALNSEEIRFTLEAGDVIVMMSDGLVGGEEDAVWLCNMVTYEWENDLEAMSKKLLCEAKERYGRSDDMTLGLVRIKPAA